MDVLSYQFDTAEQFWEELHEIASGDYHSPDAIKCALNAYLKLAAMYMDKFLVTEEDLTRCGYDFINSTIFSKNRGYVRRKLISSLVGEDCELATRLLIGAVLLIDGKTHQSTFEMMQEEEASQTVINTLWLDRHKSNRLHRIFLDMLYEMCKIQKLKRDELAKVSSEFVEFMFTIVETNDFYETDPYNYAAMKVILALNEQYMICDVEAAEEQVKQPVENRVLKLLTTRGDQLRTFGENLVFLFNRGIDDTVQLMMMKLCYLLFTTEETFQYIYHNDLKVLIDVIIRELCDLSDEEDKMRHTYLRVLHPLIQNTSVKSDGYKRCEIVSLMEQFLDEEVYDETTLRLADRCLSVEWLQYQGRRSSTPSPPQSMSSSTTSLSSTISLHEDTKHLMKPPAPPPPRKKRPAPPTPRSMPKTSSHTVQDGKLAPPPPHPRKLNMSIRNTSAMDVASISH